MAVHFGSIYLPARATTLINLVVKPYTIGYKIAGQSVFQERCDSIGGLWRKKCLRVLIQDEHNGMFYGESGRWIRTQKRAMVFTTTAAALRHCVELCNKDVLLWVCFKNSALNFSVAPFKERGHEVFTSYFALQESVVQQAQRLQLEQENLRLRKELDSIIAEGKERRKARRGRYPRPKTDGFCET